MSTRSVWHAIALATLFVQILGLPTPEEDAPADWGPRYFTNETLEEEEPVAAPSDVAEDGSEAAGPTLDERISNLERITKELVEAAGPQANGTDVIAYQINQIVALNEKRKEAGQTIAAGLEPILGQVSILESKLGELEAHLRSLIREVQSSSGPTEYAPSEPFRGGSGPFHTARATLYRSTGQSGRSEILDFQDCRRGGNCCKNLAELSDDTESINTWDTCVEVFLDRECRGDSRQYKPGTYNHANFGDFKNKISSAKPC